MNKLIDDILNIVTVVAFLGVIVYLIYAGVKYESECIYKTETVIGIVTDKEEYGSLCCAKPIIYTTVHKTEITLLDGIKTIFSDSAVYSAHEIGDEILIEVEYKYHNGELVRTDYKTVYSKQGD